MTEDLSIRERGRAIRNIFGYNRKLAIAAVLLSILASVLEGIGLSFLIPIIQIAQEGGTGSQASRIGELFLQTYQFLNVPFTLETIIVGVGVVMTVRYLSSFLVAWVSHKLGIEYVKNVQRLSFEHALKAKIEYFDEHGSDDILDTIITQATETRQLIQFIIKLIEQGFLSLMYLSVALYIAPGLTVLTIVVLGIVSFALRRVFESGYSVGDRVANSKQEIQRIVQAGTQGVRDVKLFGMSNELASDFRETVSRFADSSIHLYRNQDAMDNLYQLFTALTVFVLIYFALARANLSVAGLGAFLFAMFRLAPRASTLNNLVYKIEGALPHFIRTQEFIEELQRNEERGGEKSLPDRIDELTFDDVSFSYSTGEQVLQSLSFSVGRGDFVAFVGSSGAGKSTIISLVARLYEPDRGAILADGQDISEFPLVEWREQVSVVRQSPFIFNDTLRYNLTIGNREATDEMIHDACETAQITEFMDELPNGLDTELGDDGVRLSGGQRQRVAIARALLKDEIEVLIFDEATSDLDSELEERIHSRIESLDRDYTLLVIAHRLSTVTDADTIYMIEDGKIAEKGTHGRLLANEWRYASLYSIQND